MFDVRPLMQKIVFHLFLHGPKKDILVVNKYDHKRLCPMLLKCYEQLFHHVSNVSHDSQGENKC